MAHPALTDPTLLNEVSAWVANSNEVLSLKLVRPPSEDDPSADATNQDDFHPEFSYPVFGEQEMIFGYKGLDIKLYYASGSLATYLDVNYAARISDTRAASSSTTKAVALSEDDLVTKIREVIPHDYVTNLDVFMETVRADAAAFRPLGEKVHEYKIKEEKGVEAEFEIYQSSFESSKFCAYHKRLQTFILFFVEGASFLEDDDTKWEIYTLYEKEWTHDNLPRYHIVGYATVYPFFCYPESTRMRISQFLVLPPYQNQGHGRALYKTLYNLFLVRNNVLEITVEDPNDVFSDLRDKNDMRYLSEHDAFQGLKAPVSKAVIEKTRKLFKLTKRQTQRCIEIHLLRQLNKKDPQEYRQYRLQVKERLYKFNTEALKQLDRIERIERLNETYKGIEEEYHRILNLL